MQFNCDEVVSLVQKLCENFGAMDLQHDKASVTWICTFLQMRVKELEDKVTACGPARRGPGAAWWIQPRGPGRGAQPRLLRAPHHPRVHDYKEGRKSGSGRGKNLLKEAWLVSGRWAGDLRLALLNRGTSSHMKM